MKISLDSHSPYCVVIPARNAENFLADALASVAGQQRAPRAVVVVDDGSADRTSEIAAASGAAVIRHDAPRGPGASRNTAVAATAAPLIAFLDADDVWLPNHASRLIPLFEHASVAFVASRAEMFGALVGRMPEPPNDVVARDMSDDLLRMNSITQSAAMVSRDAFDSAGGYDPDYRLCEDYDLWLRMARVGLFSFDSEPTTRYRVHTQQVSHRESPALLYQAWRVRRAAVLRRLPESNSEALGIMAAAIDVVGRAQIRDVARTGDLQSLRALRDIWWATMSDIAGPRGVALDRNAASRVRELFEDTACHLRGVARRTPYRPLNARRL